MLWFFECYLKSESGESGWSIVCGTVRKAETRENAVAAIRGHYGHLFDEVIQCHPVVDYVGDGFDHIDASVPAGPRGSAQTFRAAGFGFRPSSEQVTKRDA